MKRALGAEQTVPLITVGGTNGKGSTCAMLERILLSAGYRVGLYTSPHLLVYNERVRINGEPAPDAALCAAFSRVEAARGETPLTYFEFGTLAAWQAFAAAGVDVVILEVGLGGRLDAVNAFDADCAVVASIDLDHMDYLGETREAMMRSHRSDCSTTPLRSAPTCRYWGGTSVSWPSRGSGPIGDAAAGAAASPIRHCAAPSNWRMPARRSRCWRRWRRDCRCRCRMSAAA